MKAVVLAGGLGTRARPFTDYSPKPLIPIFDRPLIDHIVRYLCSFNAIDRITIVTNLTGRGKQIKSYFEGKEQTLGKPLSFLNDKDEGTGGALLRAAWNLKGEEAFLVWFSDNLCPLDVERFIQCFQRNGASACMAISSKRREEVGLVKLDSAGRVLSFLEKPVMDLAMPECLGIYIFSHSFLDRVKRAEGKINLSFDILQKISHADRVYGYDIGGTPWLDVESPAKVERNIELVREIIRRMQELATRPR